jgi:dTDP-4-dehydrorhamnose 3,5-epimerase-like enzyme
MTLIETHPGESDANLRSVADRILQTLNPSTPNWWHPYELRGMHRHGDKFFREFYCVAGSVQIWLWKLAHESKTRQVIWLSDGHEVQPAG